MRMLVVNNGIVRGEQWDCSWRTMGLFVEKTSKQWDCLWQTMGLFVVNIAVVCGEDSKPKKRREGQAKREREIGKEEVKCEYGRRFAYQHLQNKI